MFPLHELVFADPDGARHPELYLRCHGPASVDGDGLHLPAGAAVSGDSYFGVFPLAQWRRLTDVATLALRLTGSGEVDYEISSFKAMAAAETTLLAGRVALQGTHVLPLALPQLDSPDLFVRITAVADATLRAVGFCTETPPVRKVALGLVITTFGRLAMVRDTIGRLQRFIDGDPEAEFGPVSLTVVDNGRELGTGEFAGTTILPNPNLGGAGGFARGLSHLVEQGATHGCFMDDDAATEPECILRTRRLLAYARDPHLAVTAAMLRAETSFMMHEQGALFEWGRNHRIISRKNGGDLRDRAVLAAVLRPEPIAYGGWWFFAFPIQAGMRFPYPMFVRGDDWLFSYLNDFRIEAMPGVCSWQDGFETKIGPVEQYLAFKAFLVAEIILRAPPHRLKTVYFFLNWLLRNLYGYCYDRAALNCAALADVLRGPAFWQANAALGPRLATLRGMIRAEGIQPLDQAAAALPLAQLPRPERRRRKWLRMLSGNGHVVPLFIARRLVGRRVAVAQVAAPQPAFAFLRGVVIYRLPDAGNGFVAVRDTARFMLLLARGLMLLGRLWLGYGRLRRDYLASIDRLCTKAWWDGTVRVADPPN